MRESNMRSNVSQDLVGFRTASPTWESRISCSSEQDIIMTADAAIAVKRHFFISSNFIGFTYSLTIFLTCIESSVTTRRI